MPAEQEGEPVADGPFGTTAPMTPEALAAAAQTALVRCGGGCTSDLDAARQALERGDALGARELYACADSAEAAFGAGLSTLLSVIEGERGDRVLADLGLPHLPASDLFGEDGYLNRYASRATGSGELSLSDGVTASAAFERILIEEGAGALGASTRSDELEVDVELSGFEGLPIGTSIVQYDCTSPSSGSRVDSGPSLYVMITDRAAALIFDCHIPFSVVTCTESGGSFEIGANGSAEGDAIEIALNDVRLECFMNDLNWEPLSTLPTQARASGQISGSVAGEVDTSDLHPLLRDGYTLDAVPAATRLRTFVAHTASVTEDLAQAACFFDQAAEDTSVAFELPDALAGTVGLTLGAVDAKTLATAATLAAAALQIAGVYDGDIALKELLCLGDSNESTCAASEVVIANINAALGGAKVRRDRVQAARVFLEESLRRFAAVSDELGATTLVPRNAQTAQGIAALRDLAQAALASLDGAATPLPFVAPQTAIDLDRFFTKLPEPAMVPGELLIYEDHCDPFECWTEQRLDATHATLLWPVGVDFTQEVELVEPHGDMIEEALEGSIDALAARFASID